MSIALSSALQTIIQQNLLMRRYHQALFPQQLFRDLTVKEEWPARTGQTHLFTRRGLFPVNTRPRVPGQDPTPQPAASVEQWSVTAQPYNDAVDTHMPTDFVSLASEFLQDAHNMALQAGQTMNHLVRNRVYNPYLGGNTYVTTTAGASTTIEVANINGFIEALQSPGPNAGRPAPVSVANPIPVKIAGVANTVTGATPDDPLNPIGSGTLTLAVATAVTAGDAVLADNRSTILRVGGAATSNGIVPGNVLTLAALRSGVTLLRQRNVMPMADGTFHMHVDPTSESQLFADPEFQSIYRGRATDGVIEGGNIIARDLMGITFIRNNEVPQAFANNTSALDYIAGDMAIPAGFANPGLPIHRPMLFGQDSIIEKHIPQRAYITSAGTIGQIGGFEILASNGGIAAVLDGIRFIIRSPVNRLQDQVSQAWAWEGDWGVPSDQFVGDAARYKRAVVFEHA